MRNELNSILINRYKTDYTKANRTTKSKLLNQLEKITELDRKHLIKLLRGKRDCSVRDSSGRPKLYTGEVVEHIARLHKLMDRISPKRMREAIPLWMPSYIKHYGPISKSTEDSLMKVSSSTIGRILKSLKGGKGKSSTQVNYKLKNKIPLKRLDEKVTKPGTVQADTVAHCGTSLLGKFVNTLTVTDIYSGWTENRASWTKDSSQIKKQLIDIEKNMPIFIQNFDTDCGTEFLNYRIMRYFENRPRKVQMRKARPYKKNDQCYVEQKNNTHVRNLFGYDRYEHECLVSVMNNIYKKYWNPLNNYFLPSFKLKEKERVGGKVKKRFEVPKTPAQRLLESKSHSRYLRNKVEYDLCILDPIELKKGLEKELKKFYRLVEHENNKQAA